VVEAYRDGIYGCTLEATPTWVMAVAGGFVFLGVNMLGYRVIKTVRSLVV
jgi:phosphate/sulfate permease